MPDATYKLIEIVGVSEESVQQAVRNGLEKASRTLRNLDWFEVMQIRGAILDDNRPQFQVEMRVGFRLLDRDVLAGSEVEGGSGGGRGKGQKKTGKSSDGGKKKKKGK